MARQLCSGKWNPVVYDNGYVPMMYCTTDGEWNFVECDTKEEAEQQERDYNDFWRN